LGCGLFQSVNALITSHLHTHTHTHHSPVGWLANHPFADQLVMIVARAMAWDCGFSIAIDVYGDDQQVVRRVGSDSPLAVTLDVILRSNHYSGRFFFLHTFPSPYIHVCIIHCPISFFSTLSHPQIASLFSLPALTILCDFSLFMLPPFSRFSCPFILVLLVVFPVAREQKNILNSSPTTGTQKVAAHGFDHEVAAGKWKHPWRNR
jgi:hypothetical protein